MAKHRSHSLAFKRQVAQEFIAGETLHSLADRHDISRNLIPIWVAEYEAGEFDDDADAADMLQAYEARIAALERLVGVTCRTAAEKRYQVRHCRPRGLSVARGCQLMGLPRSTFYDAPVVPMDDGAIVSDVTAICDEFEAYGYRRVGAVLRHQGVVVNGKKPRRLMREYDPQPRRRRRGNPYDNAKAESFMNTLKVEAVHMMAYETFEDVATDLPRFIDQVYNCSPTSLSTGIPEPRAVRGSTRSADGQTRGLILSTPGTHSIRGSIFEAD